MCALCGCKLFPDEGGVLTGTVTGTNWTADISAYRNPYSATARRTAAAQTYTMAIPGVGGSTNEPDGFGVASVGVDTVGLLKVSGYAADGSAFSAGSALSKSGGWPLYAWLSGTSGALIGWESLTTNNEVEGSVTWMKPAGGKIYPSGFTYEAQVMGGIYTNKTPILSLTNGAIVLSGANLDQNITNRVAITITNTVMDLDRTNKLSVTFLSGTNSGLFSGGTSIIRQTPNQPTPLRGLSCRSNISEWERSWEPIKPGRYCWNRNKDKRRTATVAAVSQQLFWNSRFVRGAPVLGRSSVKARRTRNFPTPLGSADVAAPGDGPTPRVALKSALTR